MQGKETPIGHVEYHRPGVNSAPAAVIAIVQKDATEASVVPKIPMDVSPFVFFTFIEVRVRLERGGGGVGEREVSESMGCNPGARYIAR